MLVSINTYLASKDKKKPVEIFDDAGGLLYNGPAGSFNKEAKDIFVRKVELIGDTLRIATRYKENI